jgi:hypothetical protein
VEFLDFGLLGSWLGAEEGDFEGVVFQVEDVAVIFEGGHSWELFSFQSIERDKLVVPIQSQNP